MATNEFQLAYEKAKIEVPIKNELQKARQLAETGVKSVIVESVVYCPYTDAILGSEFIIYSLYTNYEEAEAAANSLQEILYDDAVFVYPRRPFDTAENEKINEEDIPF
jgi:hypothetical protein